VDYLVYHLLLVIDETGVKLEFEQMELFCCVTSLRNRTQVMEAEAGEGDLTA